MRPLGIGSAPIMSWTQLVAIVGSFVVLLGAPREAAANCQNGATTQNISNGTSGSTFISILDASTPPCTLNVAPGTYTAPSGSGFTIKTGIAVVGTGGSSVTTLQVSSTFSAVSIWAQNNKCPNGATLQGFTLRGGSWGVFAGILNGNYVGCSPQDRLYNLTLRDLRIENASSGHGIDFHNVHNSVIDSSTIVDAYAIGITLNSGSSDNIVMNNVVQHTQTQHAITVLASDDNVIVGNTVSGSAFEGILVASSSGVTGPGGSRNRIERNTISGHLVDAITVADSSRYNYVGTNTAVSPSYDAISKPTPSFGSGTGIWVNNKSTGNYLFGNDLSGSPENGIDVLTSSSTYVQANRVHGNYQGGIWVANIHDSTMDPSAPPPQDTVIQGNNLFFNAMSANVFIQGATNSQVAYNFMGGTQSPLSQTFPGTPNGPSNVTNGFRLLDAPTAYIVENTVNAVSSRGFATGNNTNITVLRNRFLRGTNVPNPPQTDGLNGTTYSISPSDIRWDGGSFLGGNFWNEFAAASPYTGFIGNTNGSPYVDHFPYPSETLQSPALTSGINAPASMRVLEPVGGSVMAAGTKKTVSWIASGCVLVDLYYGYPGSSLSLIASAVPNTGFYVWTVPGAAYRSDYFVKIFCATSTGALVNGVSGVSGSFTVASSSLVQLSPGRATRAVNQGTLRVAWKKDGSVSGVNIFVRDGSGAETQVASNASGTFADITLPASVSSSSRVRIRIQNAGNVTGQDSTDGYFMVRGTSPVFTTNLAGQTFPVGSVQRLEWNGRSDSYLVDLDLVVNGSIQPIVRNLPDFGTYTVFVADAQTSNAKVRATFKDGNGGVLTSVDSATFTIGRNVPGSGVANIAPERRDFDADRKTDLIIFRPSNGTWFVRKSADGYSYSTYVTYSWGVSGDVPVSADFDGDGKLELTIWRPSTGEWWIRFSSTGFATHAVYQWGGQGDVPVVGDFDGDGKTELTVFRPSTGEWWIRYSLTNYGTQAMFQWGGQGDTPIAGDFDGDQRADISVFRQSTGEWYIRYSSLGYSTSNFSYYQWGGYGDAAVDGDFDGDGRADITVFRPSTGEWFIRYSSLGYSTSSISHFQWGGNGDLPIDGDFDGDGRADVTVYRQSTGEWFVRLSSLGYSTAYTYYQWGGLGDLLPQ